MSLKEIENLLTNNILLYFKSIYTILIFWLRLFQEHKYCFEEYKLQKENLISFKQHSSLFQEYTIKFFWLRLFQEHKYCMEEYKLQKKI